MAAQRRTQAAAPPKPVSQAVGYAQRKQREELTRLGALAGVLAIFIVPRLPSPIFGFDWKGPLWAPFAPMLLATFPNDPTLPAWLNAPMLVWLYRETRPLTRFALGLDSQCGPSSRTSHRYRRQRSR